MPPPLVTEGADIDVYGHTYATLSHYIHTLPIFILMLTRLRYYHRHAAIFAMEHTLMLLRYTLLRAAALQLPPPLR